LPPGAPRSPDDWAPVVVLPGSPQEAAVLSAQAAARQYAAGAGQSAWRRSLAPRHQSAVKKYFDKDKKDKDK
jgi:anti-sigma factor RsiW